MIKKTALLLTFVLMIIGSCKKEKPLVIEDPPKPKSITLINDNVTPGQIVLAQVSDSFKINPGTKISVSGSLTDIIDAGENKLGFIMPVLPPGKVEVDYANAGISAKLQVTIKPYTPIQDPEIVFTQFKTEIGQMKTSLSGSSLVNKVELQNLLSYFQGGMDETTAKMTLEEKLHLAYFINSNGYETTDFSDRFDKNLPDSFLWKTSALDPTDATDIFIVQLVNAKFYALLASSATLALLAAPDPTLTKGLAGATALVAITNFAIIYKLIHNDLPRLLGRAIDLEALQKKSLTLDLKDDVPFDFDTKGNFSNFTNSDKALKIFPTLFNGIDEVNNSINKFYSSMKTFKSWFNISQPESSAKLLTVGNSSNSKQLYLNPKYLSISDISNPEIKVVLTTNGNRLQLKASSTTIKTKTNFTIKLKYSQANVNHSIEKTFNAVYSPKSYIVIDEENKFLSPFVFSSEKPKSFYLSEDFENRATGIDYSKIEVRNLDNSDVDVVLGNTSASFTLTLKNKNPWKMTQSFDIFYNGVIASRIYAEVLPDCKGLNVSLSLSGKTLTSNVTGGTAPFTFKEWSGTDWQSSNERQLVDDGTYYSIVKDNNGCMDTAMGCISNVVMTGMKVVNERLEVTWTSSLGLKPQFFRGNVGNSDLYAYVISRINIDYSIFDFAIYCQGQGQSISDPFGSASYSGTYYDGKLRVRLRNSMGGTASVTFILPQCNGRDICPDKNGRGNWSQEYTVSWDH